MKKETLTAQNIRSDLLYLLRGKAILAAACAILAALSAYALFYLGKWPGPANGAGGLIEIAGMGIFFLIIAVVESWSVINLCSALRNPGRIVTSWLVAKEEKDYIAGRGLATRVKQAYVLRFYSYGEYVIPNINYRWSAQGAMDAALVHFHAEREDEFYLVLSKSYTGKILLAYNTKMFDYQPPQA